MHAMTKAELIAFEEEVAVAFEERRINGPVHLSGGNEDELIEIFRDIRKEDWVFSTWRSHYHALLHGVPKEYVMSEIMAGRSMGLFSTEHRFFSSAIVGGIAPIATGVAAGLKRQGEKSMVWCFVGDMAASIGIFYESRKYAMRNSLPITFVIENNGLSCNTPTFDTWGNGYAENQISYLYKRTYPHVGIGKYVQF